MSGSNGDHSSDARSDGSPLDALDDDPEHVAGFSENEDLLYLKYCFEGASSISELTKALRHLADDLDLRASAGWVLIAPVDSGWAQLERASVSGGR